MPSNVIVYTRTMPLSSFWSSLLLPPLLYYLLGVARTEAFNKINSFGERLKLIRLFFQVTQSHLADLMDINQGTITKIERNKFEPKQYVIDKLSALFSLNALYLKHGRAPIFSKELVFCDFFISDRNKKFQNLLSEDAIETIILYLLSMEKIRHAYVISGKPVFDIFIFASYLETPHYLCIRTDIKEGASVKKTLEAHLETDYVEDSDLLIAFDRIYNEESESPRYGNFLNCLRKIEIPENMNFLLEFSKEEILAPFTITQKDEEAVHRLLDFFVKNKLNENHIQAALKQLREMRRSETKTAL